MKSKRCIYCETKKTMNTGNIAGMLIVFRRKTNQVQEEKPQAVTIIIFEGFFNVV